MDKGCLALMIKQAVKVLFVVIVSNIIQNGKFVSPIVNEPSNPLLYIILIIPLLALGFVFMITKFCWNIPLDIFLDVFKLNIEDANRRSLILEVLNLTGWIAVFSGIIPVGSHEMTYDDYMFYYRIP